jgi:transcriptional regulator with XRE-family HTH domain
MDTYGKRMAALRKEQKMTQDELAKLLKTSISVIGRYERDEMTPSIEVAKKIAGFLNTTVGYLLGETEDANLFKDPDMLERLNDIVELPEKDKEALLLNVDAFLRDAKTRKAYKKK